MTVLAADDEAVLPNVDPLHVVRAPIQSDNHCPVVVIPSLDVSVGSHRDLPLQVNLELHIRVIWKT